MRSGILGQAKNFGTTANAVSLATRRVLETFATTRFAAPQATQSHYSDELAKHVRHAIVHLSIGAASDELLSGQEMRRTTCAAWQPLCPNPNLLFVVRDRPHGSCRITLRPWMAHPFLKSTWDTFVWGKGSMVPLMEHSPVFEAWLEQNVSAIEDSAWLAQSLKSLRGAKHRFDSSQKPAGRFCLCF